MVASTTRISKEKPESRRNGQKWGFPARRIRPVSFDRKTRLAILARDGHRCRACGIDCALVTRIRARLAALESLRPWPFVIVGERWYRPLEAWWLKAVGWLKPETSFAEADHILPSEAGGGDEAENGQVLCARCHAASTSEYATLRARGKRTGVPRDMSKPEKKASRYRWPKRKLRGRAFPKQGRWLR
jgi:5-methylcytosine-specific restriction endonuclease McrA